jgi:cytochrome d ubiquinol oxidase subunit II
MLVFLARMEGSLYFLNNVAENSIVSRIKKVVLTNFILFVVLFFFVVGYILFTDGYRYDPSTGIVSVESMKFLHSFMGMPLLLIAFLAGVVSLLYGVYIGIVKQARKAIWFSGIGTIVTVTVVMLILGWDNSVYYPSLADIQSSLTIVNSSGSHYTLSVMSVVSLLVPVVLLYIFLVWRSMDKTQMTIDEVKSDSHHY